MRVTLLLLFLAVYLVAEVNGGKCKLSDKKLKRQTKSYEKKCLKKGMVGKVLRICFHKDVHSTVT